MGLNMTPEEKEKFKELNRLRMKTWRDKTRVRKYSPRGKNKQTGVEESAVDEIKRYRSEYAEQGNEDVKEPIKEGK